MRWGCAVALVLIAGGARAQDRIDGGVADAGDPVAAPQPDKTVRDPEFGVAARHFGLERQVQMYQWRAAGPGYAKFWSAQPVDSTGFAPGHANPPFPLQSQRWLPQTISIAGRPLDAEVVALLGRWRDFRPSFSALPGNFAVTFQPEGDGLGSAENPLDPQIGDLRIRWRELVLPPLQGRIALRNGRWRLLAQQPASAPDAGDGSTASDDPRKTRLAPWLLGSGALAVLIAALALRRRRASSRRSGG